MARRLLKPDEVAELLAVARSTVYEWARERKLACIRIPGRERSTMRFREEDVVAFIEKHLSTARARGLHRDPK